MQKAENLINDLFSWTNTTDNGLNLEEIEQSTKILDNLFKFMGKKCDESQELSGDMKSKATSYLDLISTSYLKS